VKTAGVYEIVNTINGKKYIGSSVDVNKRLWTHQQKLRKNCHRNQHLQRSWNKHSEDNFKFNILTTAKGIKDLIPLEQRFLDKSEDVYNIRPRAENCLGIKHSKETKRKMSLARTGKKHSKKTRKKMSENNPKYWLGKKRLEETKQKIGEANKDRKLSEEAKQNLREVKKGNKYALGYIHSKEARQKISEARKGKKLSKETKQKLREANKGKKLSEETKRKIGEASKGQIPWNKGLKNCHSEETRKKISKTLSKTLRELKEGEGDSGDKRIERSEEASPDRKISAGD